MSCNIILFSRKKGGIGQVVLGIIDLLIPYVKIGTVIRSDINAMLTFGKRGSSGILA